VDFTSLAKQKANLEQELSEIADHFDSRDYPQMLNSICNQRFFYIKNKPQLIFDSHTGYLFPNRQYFEPNDFVLDTKSSPESIIGKVSICSQDENDSEWIYPSEIQLRLYIDSIRTINALTGGLLPSKDVSRIGVANDKTETVDLQIGGRIYKNVYCIKANDYFDHLGKLFLEVEDFALAYPFIANLASKDFSPDNKVFNANERAQKVLNLFIQEGWTPKFDDEEITKLYEKMYITRPALIKQLAEINEKLAQLPPPKTSFADGIDFAELIKGYDLASIRSSLVRYHAELVRWFSELLTSLDDFSREQAPLLAEAQILIDNLHETIDEDDRQDEGEKILTERAKYLSQHLDFGLESLLAELISFKSEAMAARNALASARTLTDLRQIEKLDRPDFYLVAEHSAELVKQRLSGVDWFREHQELARTLIELHQEWRSDLHTFEHTTCSHFMEKCAGKSIATEKANEWFSEWRRQRLLAEEHLLPLMQAGIERVVPVEIVAEAITLLKSSVRDQLGHYFFDELIPLHIKIVNEDGSLLEERIKKNLKVTVINSEFQKQLEELIFRIDGTEGRLFLVRWAKDWYDSLVGEVLAFIDKDEFHEQIARETLDGFRAMKRHTLEAFLQDVKAYAVAREEKDKEWNSLLFRMRAELAKRSN
jgi:hypothetical protein